MARHTPLTQVGRAKRIRIYERTDYCCATCGRRFAVPEGYDGRTCLWDQTYVDRRGRRKLCALEIDHIHPRLLGGTNTEENLQALCTQCNVRKGAKV